MSDWQAASAPVQIATGSAMTMDNLSKPSTELSAKGSCY